MGTISAPSYDNLFMCTLKTKLLSKQTNRPTVLLMRYIDDIFFVWEHKELELLEWCKQLNDEHPTILTFGQLLHRHIPC